MQENSYAYAYAIINNIRIRIMQLSHL